MPSQKDAIALLKADHRKVLDLFDKYETARGRKQELVKEICMELTIHTIIEEEIFYPSCKGAVEDRKLQEAQVEHDGAKMLMAELEEGNPDETFFDAKVKVLSEEIKHHVKEEEKRGGIFSQLRDDDANLKELGQRLMARKEELMAQFEEDGLPLPVTRALKGKLLEHAQPLI